MLGFARFLRRLPCSSLTQHQSGSPSRRGQRYLRSTRNSGLPKANWITEERESPQRSVSQLSLSEQKMNNFWQEPSSPEDRRSSSSTNSSPSQPTLEKKEDATDLLMENIRRAQELGHILNIIERHDKIMNHHHLARTAEQIFLLLKVSPATDDQKKELLNDPRFVSFCSRLLRSYRYMSPHAALDVLKLLSVLNAPAQSRIIQTYLHLLRESINELNLGGLMYAGYLLTKFPDSRIAEALLIAVPIAFEIRLQQEMDIKNFPKLLKMLAFCTDLNVKRDALFSVVNAIRGKVNVAPELVGTISLHDAAFLFIRLERSNLLEPRLINFVLEVFEKRKNLEQIRETTGNRFLSSMKYYRGKHANELDNLPRFHALEDRLEKLLPPKINNWQEENWQGELPETEDDDMSPLRSTEKVV